MLNTTKRVWTTVGNQKNTIELNGKHYDALTGKIVTKSTASAPVAAKAKPTSTGVSMDGLTRRSSTIRKAPAESTHHKPQTSKTLMRKAVKKPQPIVKQGHHTAHHRTASDIGPSLHVPSKSQIDPSRIERAKQIHKSKLVSKFSDAAPRHATKPSVLPLNVAEAPETSNVNHLTSHSNTQPFQKQLDHATSHQQPKPKKHRAHHRLAKKLRISPRILSVSTATLSVLLIGGFIAYQNVPNLAMRVASTRAGVHASLPSYQPAGFGMSGPIQYKPGQITISYKSNSDTERNFTITQSTSSWNSETLLENYVSVDGQPYQTYEDNGKTIYIYNGSNATWVDGGIWYNVHGNSSLNSDQLLRIANSIQ